MKKLILSAVIGLNLLGPLYAKDYIVLFKQTELSIASMEHGAFQAALQSSNQKSVTQLKDWMGARAEGNKLQDLWMLRGAAVTLDEEAAKKLGHEAWVSGIYEDKVRRLIHPSPNVVIANSVKELGDDMWGLAKIGLAKIKTDFPKLTGSGIRMGIIDTGIQSKHSELDNKKVIFKDFVNNIALPYDDQGHGTHVAGTISGKKVGIAPDVSIHFAKAFGATGAATDSTLLAAMQWMFDPDSDPATNDFPQVVSNSWGGDLGDALVYDVAEFLPYHRAIEAWIQGGIIPVFAAGNSGKNPNGFPGGLPEPISVGAISPTGFIADFSSRGPNLWKVGNAVFTFLKPDISAPGEKIISCYPGNKYASLAGTSMATPHVAGSIALVLQANPKLKFSQIKELLLKTSERKADTQYGYGVMNTYAFVKAALGE